MSLIALCGISGVGKGTVINELRLKHSDLKRVSLTKLLMQYFGIAPKDLDFEPDTDMYKNLELIPQEQKLKAINSPNIINTLTEYNADKGNIYILEVHLAVPNENTKQFEPFLPDILLKKGCLDAVINLYGNSQEILLRRECDFSSGTRERPGLLEMDSLSEEETISNIVWDKLEEYPDTPDLYRIRNENGDIKSAVEQIEGIIFDTPVLPVSLSQYE